MPRFSKKNKAELLEALYNSDSDDDDDLLMSDVHLQPSQRSPDSSVDKSPSKVSIDLPAPAPVESKEKFEERGKKQNGWTHFIRMHLSHYHCTELLTTTFLSHPLAPYL
jgi:hypothetical protein